MRTYPALVSFGLFNGTWSQKGHSVLCMTILLLNLQTTKSDIRPHIKWAVSLVITCGHYNVPQGFLTLSPQRGAQIWFRVKCLRMLRTNTLVYSQTCLMKPLKEPKKLGLLTQVDYSEKCTLEGMKGWSLNTGGLKDRFDCTCIPILHIKTLNKRKL